MTRFVFASTLATLLWVLCSTSASQKWAQGTSRGLDAAESRALIPLYLSHSSSINTAQSVLWNLQNRFYILLSKLDGRYKYDITCDQYEIFLAHYVLVVNVTLGFLEASSIHVPQPSWDGAIRGVLGRHTFQLSLILKEPYLFFVCSSCRDVKLELNILVGREYS